MIAAGKKAEPWSAPADREALADFLDEITTIMGAKRRQKARKALMAFADRLDRHRRGEVVRSIRAPLVGSYEDAVAVRKATTVRALVAEHLGD